MIIAAWFGTVAVPGAEAIRVFAELDGRAGALRLPGPSRSLPVLPA